MTDPYVVTDDISLVVQQFSDRKNLVVLPEAAIRELSANIQKSLRGVFPFVDAVPSERISGFLNHVSDKESLPVISLTGLLDGDAVAGSLKFSRSVKISRNGDGLPVFESVGHMPRHITDLPLTEQFNMLSGAIGSGDAVLADDVVFSGGTVMKMVDGLKNVGISIKKVFASVMLNDAREALHSQGIETCADIVYTRVIDEVCLRDFLVGLPDGGRNVILADGQYAAAPYISPFGDISGWASITGESARGFSRDMLSLSKEFWQEMGLYNQRRMTTDDLCKPIVFWPDQKDLVVALNQLIHESRHDAPFACAL